MLNLCYVLFAMCYKFSGYDIEKLPGFMVLCT